MAKAMIRYLTTLRASLPTPWPRERWEARLPEVVALVELFEDFHEDGDAAFSFRNHAEDLVRILDRFDRFSWAAPYPVFNRRERGEGGCGYHHAWRLITSWGRRYRAGQPAARRVRSLAYFLPRLDQESKQWRRYARRTEEREGLR